MRQIHLWVPIAIAFALFFYGIVAQADKFGSQNQQAKLLTSGQPQFSIEALRTATMIAHVSQKKPPKGKACTEADWGASTAGLTRQSYYAGMSASYCYNMLIKWDGTLVITDNQSYREGILFMGEFPSWTFGRQ